MGLLEEANARLEQQAQEQRAKAELAALTSTQYVFPEILDLAAVCRSHNLPTVPFFKEESPMSRRYVDTGQCGWMANVPRDLDGMLAGGGGVAFTTEGQVWSYVVWKRREGILSNGHTKGLPKPGAWVVQRPVNHLSTGRIPRIPLDVVEVAAQVLAGQTSKSRIWMAPDSRYRHEPSGRN